MVREKLQRKLDDAMAMLKRKEKEFDETLNHFQADIDNLESERGDLKNKLKGRGITINMHIRNGSPCHKRFLQPRQLRGRHPHTTTRRGHPRWPGHLSSQMPS